MESVETRGGSSWTFSSIYESICSVCLLLAIYRHSRLSCHLSSKALSPCPLPLAKTTQSQWRWSGDVSQPITMDNTHFSGNRFVWIWRALVTSVRGDCLLVLYKQLIACTEVCTNISWWRLPEKHLMSPKSSVTLYSLVTNPHFSLSSGSPTAATMSSPFLFLWPFTYG